MPKQLTDRKEPKQWKQNQIRPRGTWFSALLSRPPKSYLKVKLYSLTHALWFCLWHEETSELAHSTANETDLPGRNNTLYSPVNLTAEFHQKHARTHVYTHTHTCTHALLSIYLANFQQALQPSLSFSYSHTGNIHFCFLNHMLISPTPSVLHFSWHWSPNGLHGSWVPYPLPFFSSHYHRSSWVFTIAASGWAQHLNCGLGPHTSRLQPRSSFPNTAGYSEDPLYPEVLCRFLSLLLSSYFLSVVPFAIVRQFLPTSDLCFVLVLFFSVLGFFFFFYPFLLHLISMLSTGQVLAEWFHSCPRFHPAFS